MLNKTVTNTSENNFVWHQTPMFYDGPQMSIDRPTHKYVWLYEFFSECTFLLN